MTNIHLFLISILLYIIVLSKGYSTQDPFAWHSLLQSAGLWLLWFLPGSLQELLVFDMLVKKNSYLYTLQIVDGFKNSEWLDDNIYYKTKWSIVFLIDLYCPFRLSDGPFLAVLLHVEPFFVPDVRTSPSKMFPLRDNTIVWPPLDKTCLYWSPSDVCDVRFAEFQALLFGRRRWRDISAFQWSGNSMHLVFEGEILHSNGNA